MVELTLGSLFDGLGGWLLAAKENGIRPIWSSEIDDFPMAVSKYHFPEVQQLGDITKLDGAKLTPVDIICAGSPCQDLSIAGKREGLAGERSGLFRKAIDIVRGMRKATNGEFPKWFVWENVPGAFSSAVDCRNLSENKVSGTLQSKNQGGYSLNYQNPVRIGYKVRRLTPTECERLHGLPDGYTLIDDKKCSDSARYKALGNGMAQPCADFVMQRITEVSA